MSRRWATTLVLSTLSALPAAAQNADDPRARQFFDVGAEAYAKGQYGLAIEAFEQAYAIVKRPGLLFSLAQAHHRQFRASADARNLEAALDFYRRYLATNASGTKRQQAQSALASLTAAAERLRKQGGQAPVAQPGKLLISSRTPGVTVRVNDEPVESLPTSLELPNNTYVVVAEAPGYESFRQELQVSAGIAVPLSIELRPLPARLIVRGPAGAEAFIDGRPVGSLPLPPLALDAGEHWLGVRQSGRRTHSSRVQLQRGQTTTSGVELDPSVQRTTAYVVGATGLVTLVAAGVFVGVAVERDGVASDLSSRLDGGDLARSDAERLNSAVESRDRFRGLALGTGIASFGLLASAVVLYLADSPAAPRVEAKAERGQRAVKVRPVATDSRWGAELSGRF